MSKSSGAPARSQGYRGKREEAQLRRQKRQWIERVIAIAVVASLVLGGVALVVVNQRPPAHPDEREVVGEGSGHVEANSFIEYQNDPPSSGPHYPSPVQWGLYMEPVPPGHWVHNLEHGGIVLLFECPADGCDAIQAELAELLDVIPLDGRFNEKKIVITPYDKPLPAPVVVLAWKVQLNLDSLDREAIVNFYRRHVNLGPEVVP